MYFVINYVYPKMIPDDVTRIYYMWLARGSIKVKGCCLPIDQMSIASSNLSIRCDQPGRMLQFISF